MKPKFRTCGALLGSAMLFFSVSQTRAADGTWSVDENGAWSEDVKWASSVIADGAGFTANFTNDQTADATITLDTPRSIGHLVFGDADTATACSWLLTGSVLTLDATTPSITVDNLAEGSNATISTILAGTAGLTKFGNGTLVLSGLNTYTGLTTATAGTLTVTGNAIKTGILVNGGTMNVQAGNTMSGGITVDSGLLTLSGANTFSAGTTINGGTVNAALAGALGSGNLVNNGTLNLTAPTAGDITYSGMNTVTGSGTINVSLLSAGTANTNFTSTRLLNGNYSGFSGTINVGPSTGLSGGKIQYNGLDSSAVTLNVKPNASVYLSSNVVKNSKIVLEGGDLGETLGQLRLDTGNWAGEVVLAGAATGTSDGLVGSNAGGTISGVISETGGSRELTKAGGGSINLAGVANTFTGDVRVLGGTLGVTLMGMTGSPSSLGQGSTLHLGNGAGTTTLSYLGAGESSNRVINLAGTIGGGSVNHNGTGALTLTASPTATGVGGKTLTLSGNAASPAEYSAVIGNIFTNGSNHATTASAAFTTAVNTITVASVTNVAIGSTIAGTGIVGGTRVTAISGTGPYTVTLSANTNGAGASGQAINFTQANALSKTGSGLWKLSADNSYTGITSITGGILEISHANALGSATSGTVQSGGAELRLTGNITTAAETLSINGGGIGNAGALRNFSGDNTYTGAITMAAQSRINSDSGTLTLNAATAISGAFNLVVGGAGNMIISGGMSQGVGGVSKDGSGTLTLSGINTFTGGSSANGGTLKLDYSVNDTSKLSDTGVLTLGGGTIELSGGTHLEVVLSTTLSAGISTVSRSSGSAVLEMNTITPAAGAVVNFTGNNIATTDNLNNASNILGSWATVTIGGVTSWATNSTNTVNGLITAYAHSLAETITRLADSPTNTGIVPNNSSFNVLISNGGSAGNVTLAAAPLTEISSLKMDASDGPSIIEYASATDTFMIGIESGGGIHQTSTSGALTIGAAANAGILTTGLTVNATPATLNIINDSITNDVIINSTITNNGTDVVSLGKAGAGLLILNGSNTHTGSFGLGVGSVKIGSATALGANPALTMGVNTLLDLNGNNINITSLTGVGTSKITDHSTGAGTTTLNATVAEVAVPVLIQDGGEKDIALRITNTNDAFSLTNPANTFSGGIVLTNGTRMSLNGIVAGAHGIGSITVGESATDTTGIYLFGANQTLTNPIIANTGRGTDRNGTFRIDATGIIFSGQLSANLSHVNFSTNGTGSATVTGKITGSSGISLSPTPHDLTTARSLTITLNNAAMDNDYAGNTTINNGALGAKSFTLALAAGNQIPNGTGKGNVIINTVPATTSPALAAGVGTLNVGAFSETINGLGGNGTFTGVAGGVLTLGDADSTSSYSGGSSGAVALTKIGTGTQTMTAGLGHTGVTTVSAGTLQLGGTTASPSHVIASGAILNFNNAVAVTNTASTTFTGGGTLRKTGAGTLTWGSGVATVSLSSGALIEVLEGTLTGASNANEVWTNNKADLHVATGAVFDGVEATSIANGGIFVDAVTGGGSIRIGYPGSFASRITLGVDNGDGTFDGVISNYSAPGHITKAGTGIQTLAGINTYTGNTTVSAGTLALADNAQLRFVIGANGVNNTINGTANLNLEGDFNIITTGADTTSGNTWSLVDVANLTETYGSTFSVVGYTEATPGVWEKIEGVNKFTFTESTGLLTVAPASAYITWAATNGLTAGNNAMTDNPDGDADINLAEFAFGGNPLSGADNAKSFVFAADSSDAGTDKDLILTIAVRSGTPAFTGSPSPTATHDGVTYNIEGSLDLNGFPSAVRVVDPITTNLPTLGSGYEYRSFTLDASNGLLGKGFLRGKVTTTP